MSQSQSQSRLRSFSALLAVVALAIPVMAFASVAQPGAARSPQYDIQQLSANEISTLLSSRPVLSPQFSALSQQPGGINFANAAFQRVWERTDKLVASGAVKRSWYWGPAPGAVLQEDYAEGAGGKRVVQYFDKSRMEINNPQGDPNSPFFVTNGLLTVELISGKVQTGNSTYTDRYSAAIPLASDTDDPDAPTYASFLPVSNTPLGDRPAQPAMGQAAILTITRAGTVREDPTKSTYPSTRIAHFEQATKHNIPEAIWQFLNETGPVYNSVNGLTTTARLSDPWFYATGYPISEPYWANVKIAGQKQDVLIQAFERRVVTYAPNGVPGFKVQMGNIGQHYYDWRYRDAGRPATTPTPVVPATPTRPAVTATRIPPTAVPDPNADCSGIPPSQNTTITPSNCGPGGTRFTFIGSGFDVNEVVGVYVTDPTQAVYGAPFQAQPDPQGRVGITFQTDRSFPPGVWAMTMEGVTTKRKAIGYFKLTSPPATPTRPAGGPPPPCDTSASRNGEARPNQGTVGDVIQITARGFQPGENVSYWFTFPDGEVVGTEEGIPGLVNPDGTIGPLPLEIDEFIVEFPGTWGLTFKGDSSGNLAVIYFCIY